MKKIPLLCLLLTLGAAGCATAPATTPPAAAASGGGPEAATDQAPIPLKMVAPVYPTSLRDAGITGTVLVDFVVGPDGTVLTAHAVSAPDPDLAQAAVKAILKSRFQPGRRAGKPVAAHLRMPYYFNLSDK